MHFWGRGEGPRKWIPVWKILRNIDRGATGIRRCATQKSTTLPFYILLKTGGVFCSPKTWAGGMRAAGLCIGYFDSLLP